MPDYSCYITIVNNLNVDLTLISSGTGHGNWQTTPPAKIPKNSTSAQFQAKDSTGSSGCDGWVRYRVDLQGVANDNDKPVAKFEFNNPAGNIDNTYNASCENNLGSSLVVFSHTEFGKRGNPLTVAGTVAYNNAIKTGSSVTSIKFPDPTLNVFNTQSPPVNHRAPNVEIWNLAKEAQFTDNDNPPKVAGSFWPVCADLTSDVRMNVTLNFDNSLVGVTFYLAADLGSYKNVIKSPTSQYFKVAGEQTISVTVQPSWKSNTFPWGVVGDLVWKVIVGPSSQELLLNTSRVEIYALTKNLPAFYNNQISVAFLRRIILPSTNYSSRDWIDYVIEATFGTTKAFKFRYDTRWGAPSYGVSGSGGNFNLNSWTAQSLLPDIRVNCYDQAAIDQIAFGLAPSGESEWYYMKPFGYISETNLIGVGKCNNPFYESYKTTPLIGNNDPKRTAFGNHAFVSVKSKTNQIADSCAGPHRCSEALANYISASIDGVNQTTLYTSTNSAPGTTANASLEGGVTSINHGIPTVARLAKMTIPESVSQIVASASPSEMPTSEHANVPLKRVHDFVSDRLGLKVLDHSHQVSPGGTELSWLLSSDTEGMYTHVKIAVLSSPSHAESYFKEHLTKYHRPLEEIFTAPPQGMSKGRLCLTSPPGDEAYGQMVWVHGNVFARVDGPYSLQKLDDFILKPLNQLLAEGTTKDEAAVRKPIVGALHGLPDPLKAGHEFEIHPTLEGCGQASVRIKNHTVCLLSQDAKTHAFRFRAERPGPETLTFAFAHPETGMVTAQELSFDVVA